MDDNGTPLDPNDDREYMVVGRSDGIMIVNVTPSRAANPSATPAWPQLTMTSPVLVEFFPEPTPHAIASVFPIPLGPTSSRLDWFAHLLNGTPDYTVGPNFGNLTGTPYCPPTAQPSYRPWSSAETPNREVAVFRSPSGTYFIYSVSTWRAGLWVMLLSRSAAGELTGGTGGTWQTVTVAGTALGECHNIYVDPVAGREALYVTDERGIGRVCQLDLTNPAFPGTGSPPLGPARVILNSGAHDAMPYGDQLFVSGQFPSLPGSGKGTAVYDLPLITPPFVPRSTLVPPIGVDYPGGHSVYVDTQTPFVEGRVIAMQEDPLPCSSKLNFTILAYDKNLQASVINSAILRAVVPYVNPTGLGFPQFPNTPTTLSPMHNLRGRGRMPFGAQYREGIFLFDFYNDESTATSAADPSYRDNASLGSFDTTVRVDGVPVPPPLYPINNPPAWAPYATQAYWAGTVLIPGLAPPAFWDNFLGAWDVAVEQDSGLIYAGLGPNLIPNSTTERFLTAGVFRVNEGHMNRYWDATPFPSTSSNSSKGLVPSLEFLQGPPRKDRKCLLGDANGGKYDAYDGQGFALLYEYTLIFHDQAPVGVGGSNPAVTTGVQWDPDSTSSTNNNIWLNVFDHTQPIIGAQWVRMSPLTSPDSPATGYLLLPPVGAQGTRWFCQLLVQEYETTGPTPQKTGRWAASRGHWFGVARG